MHEKRSFRPPVIGGSSLLVIFAVLCLTIFAFLGLGTVQAGERLSDAAAESVQNYYAADTAAEEILAQIRSGVLPDEVEKEGDVYTYTCAVSEKQMLCITAEVSEETYHILRWQTISTADWNPDNTIDIWDGDPVSDLG